MGEYRDLPKMYIEEDKDFIFTDKCDGKFIDVKTIFINPSGKLDHITTYEEVDMSSEECKYERYILYVPGIGYISPGSIVVYHNKNYILQFGWHTNISNQTIYSWYLSPTEDASPDKTLYYDMINQINIIHFR